ncbi:MAG: putative RND superfamily exporter protein [Pseudoalteromonas tetraodonis]
MKIADYIDSFGLTIADYALSRPWRSILISMVLVATTAPGLPKNSISTDHRSFFGPENPQLVAYDQVEETYNKLDNIIFVIRTEGSKALAEKTYPVIQFVTEQSWQLPAASRVDSLSNYQHTSIDQDDLLVEDLLGDRTDFTADELVEKESIALAEPLLAGNMIARDGYTSAVSVVAKFDNESGDNLVAFVSAARELAKQAEERYPGTRVALTGSVMMSSTFTEAGRADAKTLIPGMYLILLIALLCVYRSVSATIGTFLVVSASTIVPLGFMGYSGIQLTSITIIAPIIIMTLAVADSVHILMTMLNLMRKGAEKKQALRESLRLNFLAVSITSVTTIVGFLCLNYSDSPPFKHLGNLSAIGIVAAWFFSVLLLPAVMTVLPLKVKVRAGQGDDDGSRGAMAALARFTTSHSKSILVVSAVLSISLISQLPKLELNDHFVKFFDKEMQFRVDTDFAQEHLGGMFFIQFNLQSGSANGINNPKYLKALDQFTTWLRAEELVTSVFSYSDIAKRLNRNMHADDDAFYRVADNAELAAQYLLLYELSLPYGLDLTDRINLDKSATRVTAVLGNPTASQVRNFAEQSKIWLATNTYEAMRSEPTGTPLLFSYISKRNIEGMINGNIIAIVAITLLMIVALNHIGLGLLSMLPNLLPVVLALSVWALLIGTAGMATTIIAASSLGIVVDNTTHFLSKYLRARREKSYSKFEAINYSFETVGVAIIANAFVLMSGFALLSLSNFQPNFQMGVLTALTIAIALVVDLICLPALLMMGRKEATTDS